MGGAAAIDGNVLKGVALGKSDSSVPSPTVLLCLLEVNRADTWKT